MNNTRRDQIARIKPMVEEAFRLLTQAKREIEDVKDEEESAFSEASEGRQNGDWGEESTACTEAMQTLIDALDSIDLVEPLDELGRAIDRALEAPPAKLTKDVVDARRQNRLPQWAKNALKRAQDAQAAAEQKQEAGFKIWAEGSNRGMLKDYFGPIDGKEVPCDIVEFPQVGIRVSYDKHRKALELHGTDMGSLVICGNASNVMYARISREMF